MVAPPERARARVELRLAGPDDLETLVGIHERSSRLAYAHIFPPDAPFPTEALVRRWRPSLQGEATSVAFVAELDGVAVGGAIADAAPAKRGFGNLRHLYVEPTSWGSGAGRALHDAVVEWCRDAGAGELELWVLEANERSREMYERWGWTLDPDERLVHDGLEVAEVRYVLAWAPSS